MSQGPSEPIRSQRVNIPATMLDRPAQNVARPANIDALIGIVQREFPTAGIRITGRGRTVEGQAELMAQRRIDDRAQFLRIYIDAPHITEMDNWVSEHPRATLAQTSAAFAQIINRARQSGAVVSNH